MPSGQGGRGPRRVVLLGAGHTHVQLLRRGTALTGRGHRVVLVAPDDFWYSGLAPGVLAGRYPPGTDRIDVGALAREAGATLVRAGAVGAQPASRTLLLEGGETLEWDLLSVNVGSRSGGLPVSGSGRRLNAVVPVKPIRDLLDIPRLLRDRAAAGRGTGAVVVGGGASGCEVALALVARARREGTRLAARLVSAARLLPGAPPGAARTVRRALEQGGVEVVEGARVREVSPAGPVLATGEVLETDLVVDASGLRPAPVAARLGLPVDADGAIRVDRFLRSVADPRVFAVGDCAAFEPRPLARVGVHAVRQGRVLLENLLAVLEGRPPVPYRPPRRYLLILNLSDGTGLAIRGRLHLRGRSVFRLKDALDRRFLEGR